MKRGKYNILVDAFHGSSGKGKMSTMLALEHQVEHLVSTNMPNAGHTALFRMQGYDDVKFIGKCLPTGAILNNGQLQHQLRNWTPEFAVPNRKCWLGPTAAFTLEQFFKEVRECFHPYLEQKQTPEELIFIHPRAAIITDEHKKYEQETLDGPRSIASTMQGSGKCLADKILRSPNVVLARDIPELKDYVAHLDFMPRAIKSFLNTNETFLHEVSQGIGLDISNGSHYPHCTSRSTSSVQALCDMGISLRDVGDIYLNVHATPIRVGSIEDGLKNGSGFGYSGDFYPDAQETTWEEVGRRAGMPEEEIAQLTTRQRTTVTGRIRRVFEFSWDGLERAVLISGATKLILNFAQYIDWRAHRVKLPSALPHTVWDFVRQLERKTGLPVAYVGTGENWSHYVRLDD